MQGIWKINVSGYNQKDFRRPKISKKHLLKDKGKYIINSSFNKDSEINRNYQSDKYVCIKKNTNKMISKYILKRTYAIDLNIFFLNIEKSINVRVFQDRNINQKGKKKYYEKYYEIRTKLPLLTYLQQYKKIKLRDIYDVFISEKESEELVELDWKKAIELSRFSLVEVPFERGIIKKEFIYGTRITENFKYSFFSSSGTGYRKVEKNKTKRARRIKEKRDIIALEQQTIDDFWLDIYENFL